MNRTTLFSAALCLSALAGSAWAQTSQPTKSTDPVLQGPSVKEGGVPGENRQFGDGKVKSKERMGTEIPHRMFMQALDVLRGDSVEPTVRLTDTQDSKIKEVNGKFIASVSAYRQANATEVRELAQQLTPEDRRKAMEFLRGNGIDRRPGALLGEKGKGKKAPAPAPDAKSDDPADMTDAAQATDPKKSEDAKAKLREIFEAAPKPADTHAQIFAVLTDAQKPVFQKELDRLKKDVQDRAGERKTEHKKALKDGATKPAPTTNKDVDVPAPSTDK